jgi:hypothetical protein
MLKNQEITKQLHQKEKEIATLIEKYSTIDENQKDKIIVIVLTIITFRNYKVNLMI